MRMETRKRLETLYSEYVGARQDGGLSLALDDHLNCVTKGMRICLSDQQLAESMGVPMHYIVALRAGLSEKGEA